MVELKIFQKKKLPVKQKILFRNYTKSAALALINCFTYIFKFLYPFLQLNRLQTFLATDFTRLM